MTCTLPDVEAPPIRAPAAATSLARRARPSADPIAVLDEMPASDRLTDEEAQYVAAARAANTLRGYRSDWAEFTGWCEQHTTTPLPAGPAEAAPGS